MLRFVLSLTLAILLAACDSGGPLAPGLSGDYDAIVLTAVGPADGGVDLLRDGGSLSLTFEQGRRYTGRLVLGGSPQTGFPHTDAALVGSYTVDGDVVTLVPEDSPRPLLWVERVRVQDGG